MPLLSSSSGGALKKLTIEASPSGGLKKFEAQFNPTSFKHVYQNAYQRRQGINTSGSNLKYLASAPEVVQFTLILQKLDRKPGLLSLGAEPSVYDQVQQFLKLAYAMDGAKHSPRQLIVSWGKMRFLCALESAQVNYTAFDYSAAPLRAEIDVTLRGWVKDPKKATVVSSPDLTHAKTVKVWQTLPMITEEIYGDPHLYLLVAEANGLDHFRALKSGQKLHFPPTEKEETAE
jgi:Contractile injection system tube protein